MRRDDRLGGSLRPMVVDSHHKSSLERDEVRYSEEMGRLRAHGESNERSIVLRWKVSVCLDDGHPTQAAMYVPFRELQRCRFSHETRTRSKGRSLGRRRGLSNAIPLERTGSGRRTPE